MIKHSFFSFQCLVTVSGGLLSLVLPSYFKHPFYYDSRTYAMQASYVQFREQYTRSLRCRHCVLTIHLSCLVDYVNATPLAEDNEFCLPIRFACPECQPRIQTGLHLPDHHFNSFY